MTIHEKHRRRSRCTVWTQTVSERRGPLFEGLRKPLELITMVVTVRSSGCPVQAIVQAFGLDERTVADGRDRAGTHGHQLHEAMVEQGQRDLVPVQADEIRVKGRTMSAWMGVAMMGSTRRWLAGTVRVSRDTGLARAWLQHVRRAATCVCPLLVVTDGWSASPGSMRRAFRENVPATPGPGRACVRVWPDVHGGTVITRTENKRVVEITRTMAPGLMERAEQVRARARGGEVLHTACIERLHGTVRERLASLTHTRRHAASRVQAVQTGMDVSGCTSHGCVVHQERSTETQWSKACPPAMARGLTDHVWSVSEVLRSTVAPAPWVQPQRRGKPPQQMEHLAISTHGQKHSSSSRPLVRLRKGPFCSPTGEGGSTGWAQVVAICASKYIASCVHECIIVPINYLTGNRFVG